MQALLSNSVPLELSSHFDNRRIFDSLYSSNGYLTGYLSDDPIEPTVAYVLELPEGVSNSAISQIKEALFIRSEIKHPHLSTILETGQLSERMFYWLVSIGWPRNLSDVLKEPHPNELRLLRLLIQVGEGLEAMHDEGLCFGGLTENTVFVGLNPEGSEHAFLAGCTVASWIQERQDPEKDNFDLAQARVLAPECVIGGTRSTASDIYAFGVLLYRVLKGRFPFDSSEPSQVLKGHTALNIETVGGNISEPLWSMVLQCLRKDPNNRPESISVVINRIKSHIDDDDSLLSIIEDIPLSTAEENVPLTTSIKFEDSEDLLSVISDSLDMTSEEDSSKGIVEILEDGPPVLPEIIEEFESRSLNMYADVEWDSFEEEQNFESHGPTPVEIEVEPSQMRMAVSGSVKVSLELNEIEDDFIDEESEAEISEGSASVMVGVVPYQVDMLENSGHYNEDLNCDEVVVNNLRDHVDELFTKSAPINRNPLSNVVPFSEEISEELSFEGEANSESGYQLIENEVLISHSESAYETVENEVHISHSVSGLQTAENEVLISNVISNVISMEPNHPNVLLEFSDLDLECTEVTEWDLAEITQQDVHQGFGMESPKTRGKSSKPSEVTYNVWGVSVFELIPEAVSGFVFVCLSFYFLLG